MYRMPSHTLATHICTFAQSLRNGDVGACVAARLVLAQRSKPERAGEVAVQMTKYGRWRERNARVYLPDPTEVQHWQVSLEQSLQFQASCRALQAFHEDGQHTVVANVEDSPEEARDPGNATYREARTANTEDR